MAALDSEIEQYRAIAEDLERGEVTFEWGTPPLIAIAQTADGNEILSCLMLLLSCPR